MNVTVVEILIRWVNEEFVQHLSAKDRLGGGVLSHFNDN
jgi:hypothetical protein